MTSKSRTCIGKKTGKPLTEYLNIHEAKEGADYANSLYGRNLSPYKCNNCDMWHLTPKDRQTPSQKCPECTDSNGHFKNIYDSYESAKKRALILYLERYVNLKVYECPKYEGWHLTKN